jgi:hypothetical protein
MKLSKKDSFFEEYYTNPFSIDFDVDSLYNNFDVLSNEKFNENNTELIKFNSDIFNIDLFD